MAPVPLDVTIHEKPVFEEVDAEIVVIAGCALGFVSKSCPPHVLHIEKSSDLDRNGIQMDDILYRVNGVDVGNPFLGKEEIMKRLTEKLPLTLSFVKPADAATFLPNYNKAEDEDEAAPAAPAADEQAKKKEKKRRRKYTESSQEEEKQDTMKATKAKRHDPDQDQDTKSEEEEEHEQRRQGVRDAWTIDRTYKRTSRDRDGSNSGRGGKSNPKVVLVERKHVVQPGVQVHGVWHPPGTVPQYLADATNTRGAPTNYGVQHGGGNVPQNGAAGQGGNNDTDTIMLQNLPAHLRSLVAISPVLAEMGFADVKHMRAMSNQTAMAISFHSVSRAQECLSLIQRQGHFAGDRNIHVRFYYQNHKNKGRGKGGRSGGPHNRGDNETQEGTKGGGSSASNNPRGDARTSQSAAEDVRFENQTLESEELAAKRQQKQSLEDKKKLLIQHVTERMQQVLRRLNEPNISEEHKLKFNALLQGLKAKLTTLSATTKKSYSETAFEAASVQQQYSLTGEMNQSYIAQHTHQEGADGDHTKTGGGEEAGGLNTSTWRLKIHLVGQDLASTNLDAPEALKQQCKLEELFTEYAGQFEDPAWDVNTCPLVEDTKGKPDDYEAGMEYMTITVKFKGETQEQQQISAEALTEKLLTQPIFVHKKIAVTLLPPGRALVVATP
ncbi:unnamed protein product [Amoebophrya sp. A120]|nr:unnamed protein product [Amoebophrya sp. A120]|eukprot:GSA120T00018063001.1